MGRRERPGSVRAGGRRLPRALISDRVETTPAEPVRLGLPTRRVRRRIRFGLVLVGVAALVAGVIVILPGHETTNAPSSKQNAQLAQKEIRTPSDPQAVRIGREFIETAVMRKNLSWAYDHAHP